MSRRRDELKARVDAIEESYEFLLAYAAQGLTTDVGAKSGGQLRGFLSQAAEALDGFTNRLRALVGEEALEPSEHWPNFLDVVERDADAALAAVQLVAGQPSVSSQLVDNLNANIHVRALLTDLFLVDELIGP